MNAARFMYRPTTYATPNEALDAASRKMDEALAHVLPVLTEGRLVGVLHRDVLCLEDTGQRLEVEDVMSREVRSCRPSDTIGSVLATFDSTGADVLVVTDDAGALVGLLNSRDLPFSQAQ